MHLNALERQPGIIEEMAVPDGFRMAGWVYVLSNEFMPGIYKVGMTTTSPELRAKELSAATGVPYPFKVEAAFHCEDPARSEREIHEAFKAERVNDSREFFKYDLEELKHECESLCEAKVGDNVEYLAMRYDVISFETLSKLNLPYLFEDIGINVLGDRLAVAERLIRLGAERIITNLNSNGISAVFHDGNLYAVMDAETSWRQRENVGIGPGLNATQLPAEVKPNLS